MWLCLPVSAFKEYYLKKPVGTLSRQIFTRKPTSSLLFHASPLACFGTAVGNRDKKTINETFTTTETQKQRQRLLCAILSLIKESYFFKKTPLPPPFLFQHTIKMSSEAPCGQLAALTTASQVAMKTTLQRARDLKTTSVFVCVPQIKGVLIEQCPSVWEWASMVSLGNSI